MAPVWDRTSPVGHPGERGVGRTRLTGLTGPPGQAAAFGAGAAGSSIRTGSTMAFSPANWSRRWSW